LDKKYLCRSEIILLAKFGENEPNYYSLKNIKLSSDYLNLKKLTDFGSEFLLLEMTIMKLSVKKLSQERL
jgi:hypothetical protein